MASADVDAWFADYEHPLIDAMQLVRRIMLDSHDQLDECIKWKSPRFPYQGTLASFNPHTKKHVSLMFHTGAQIPGEFPSMERGGETARYIKFHSTNEGEARRDELRRIVEGWVALRS